MKTFPEITEPLLTPRIVEILAHPLTGKLVNRYFNPQGHEGFAGNYFHTLGVNDPKSLKLGARCLKLPAISRQSHLR